MDEPVVRTVSQAETEDVLEDEKASKGFNRNFTLTELARYDLRDMVLLTVRIHDIQATGHSP